MCVIIVIPAGVSMPKEALYNAVYNNPHSYGLILKDGNGKTSLVKDAPAEVDPALIEKLLNDNIDVKRYLHLRWATRGGKNLDNAQFFEVYHSGKRTVYFGHNGTLDNKFGGLKDDDPSDTKDFADKVVTKALLKWSGENGKADYIDSSFYDLIIKPQWTNYSKGILVSNDLDDLMFGPDINGWTNLTINGEKLPIMVSNTDYFATVNRGPEKDRREAKRREEEAAKRGQETFQFRNGPIPSIADRTNLRTALNFARDMLSRDTKVLEAIKQMFNNLDITTREGLATLAYVSREEFQEFLAKNPSSTVIELLVLMSDALDESEKDIKNLGKKIERMQKRINNLEGRDETKKVAS